MEKFRKILLEIVEDWDKWRIKHREEGDPDNERITRKERTSRGLYNAVSEAFALPKGSKNKVKIDRWIDELSNDAAFNFESYAECFISENLVRKYIEDKKIVLSKEAKQEIKKWKDKEKSNKDRANISIELRQKKSDLNYLDMSNLANLADKAKDPNKESALSRDAITFKPIRDAVAHTALLTDAAKVKLSTVRENIKARVKSLLSKAD